MLSLGGRVTLLNSIISSIPIYWLSMYRMPVQVRQQIDKLRKRFLWSGGSTIRKKYHLVEWKNVCLSKEQGGLGVLDLKNMNLALLAKWWFRFKDPTIKGK